MHKDDFADLGGRQSTVQHGAVELACFRPADDAAEVPDAVRSHVACGVFDSPQLSEGIDLMSLYAYVNFNDQGVFDDGEHY